MQGHSLEFKGDVNSEALLTAVAAGTPPDGGSNFDYPNLWSRGAVLRVNELVDASTKIKKNDVAKGLWDGSFYGADMIGIPGIEGFNWWGLNYNTKAVEEAGLDPDNPPLTWEGVYEWHEALTKFDDAGNLLQFGLDPWDAMASEPDFAATSWGFTWWDEENQTFNLDNAEMAESIDVMGQFISLIGPDQFQGMRNVEGNGTWGAAYNAGVQTMIMEGYWHPGETQIQQPDIAQYNRSTWAPVPAKREGAKIMATGPHFVQLFKDGNYPNEMFLFAEHLFEDKPADIIFEEVGWIFGRLSWLETADKNAYPGLEFYMDASAQVTDWIVGRRCPIHWFMNDQYVELRERVYRGEMSSTDAVAELQKRAVDEWDAQGL
jgi:multiple sugar transport system substrate-binding protein